MTRYHVHIKVGFFPSYELCNWFGINMESDFKIGIIEVFKKRLLDGHTSSILYLMDMENKL